MPSVVTGSAPHGAKRGGEGGKHSRAEQPRDQRCLAPSKGRASIGLLRVHPHSVLHLQYAWRPLTYALVQPLHPGSGASLSLTHVGVAGS